jgi:hypothetical protein
MVCLGRDKNFGGTNYTDGCFEVKSSLDPVTQGGRFPWHFYPLFHFFRRTNLLPFLTHYLTFTFSATLPPTLYPASHLMLQGMPPPPPPQAACAESGYFLGNNVTSVTVIDTPGGTYFVNRKLSTPGLVYTFGSNNIGMVPTGMYCTSPLLSQEQCPTRGMLCYGTFSLFIINEVKI